MVDFKHYLEPDPGIHRSGAGKIHREQSVQYLMGSELVQSTNGTWITPERFYTSCKPGDKIREVI
jgi:hypothetical protein